MGDKNTGKDERITIKNDKGRPSQEEVERMVAEAEKYAKEDEEQKSRIEAKNSLESYVFNMKTSVEDEKVAEKLSEEDKKTVLDKCNEGVAWIDANQTAEKDEFEDKKKEIESVCAPIISKLYAGAGGMPGGMPGGVPGGMPGGMPDMGGAGGAGSGPT